MPGPQFGDERVVIRPIARGSDADTSHEAQAYMERSGRMQSQLRATLTSVLATPGLTAMELWNTAGHDRHKRLSDLLELGYVRKGAVRACTATGRTAATWWATPEGGLRIEHGLPIVKVRAT